MNKFIIIAIMTVVATPALAGTQCDPTPNGGFACHHTMWLDGLPSPQLPPPANPGADFGRAINSGPWGVPLPFQRR